MKRSQFFKGDSGLHWNIGGNAFIQHDKTVFFISCECSLTARYANLFTNFDRFKILNSLTPSSSYIADMFQFLRTRYSWHDDFIALSKRRTKQLYC